MDALRGFALLGIFVVNITFMASAYPGNLVDDPNFSAPIDAVVRFLVAALFSMKFYLLFSFLFGYSFVLQMDAAGRAGAAFVPRMLRRSLGLFILGAGHIVLLYSGDVLTTYAVICLVLLAMHHVRDRTALLTSGIIYAFVTLSLVISAAFLDRSMFMPSHDEALSQAAAQTQTMLGGPIDILGHHLAGLDLLVIQAASLQGPTALAMFLIGMIAARRRLFSNLGEKSSLLRRIQVIGFAVGLPGGVLFAWLGGDTNTLGHCGERRDGPVPQRRIRGNTRSTPARSVGRLAAQSPRTGRAHRLDELSRPVGGRAHPVLRDRHRSGRPSLTAGAPRAGRCDLCGPGCRECLVAAVAPLRTCRISAAAVHQLEPADSFFIRS